jgi:hypothetical protein
MTDVSTFYSEIINLPVVAGLDPATHHLLKRMDARIAGAKTRFALLVRA